MTDSPSDDSAPRCPVCSQSGREHILTAHSGKFWTTTELAGTGLIACQCGQAVAQRDLSEHMTRRKCLGYHMTDMQMTEASAKRKRVVKTDADLATVHRYNIDPETGKYLEPLQDLAVACDLGQVVKEVPFGTKGFIRIYEQGEGSYGCFIFHHSGVPGYVPFPVPFTACHRFTPAEFLAAAALMTDWLKEKSGSDVQMSETS